MRQMKKMILAVLVLCSGSYLSAQKVSLQYNLKQGSVMTVNMNSVQNIHQEIQGMTMDIKMTIGGKTSYTVDKVESGNFFITVSYETLTMKMESAMMNSEYDSQGTIDPNNPMHTALNAIVGSKFQAVMDAKGKVISVSGFEDIMKKLTDSMGGDKEKADQVAAGIKQQFSDESMKSSIETMTAIFPDAPVAVGDTWVVKTITKSGMEINNENTLTLKEATADKWVIEGIVKLVTNSDVIVPTNGMSSRFSLSGDGQQNITMNPSTGWFVEVKQHQLLDGKVAIEGGQLPAPMEIPMKIEGDTQTTTL